MFRSIAITSASIPLSKSSAASIYGSSYGKKIGKNLTDNELNLKIKNLRRYEISCIKDGSEEQGWAEFGIGVANFFGAFTGTKIDYPDHWFLIAEAETALERLINQMRASISSSKFKEIKEELENLISKEKKIYYLIEKGGNAKTVSYFENIDDIIKLEKNNYNNNEVHYKESYKLEKNITIKDIIDYVETLSDEYNLIDDNCQVFVRNIINHFC